MFTRTIICSSIALALTFSGIVFGEWESRIELKNETSFYARSGQVTGAAKTTMDDKDDHDAGDVLKFENSVRFFLNNEIDETTAIHADLNLIYDTKGGHTDNDKWKGHQFYTHI